jgi:hypothetical protein
VDAGQLADGDVYAFLTIIGELVGEELDPSLDVGVLHDVGRLVHRFGAAQLTFRWTPGSHAVAWGIDAAPEIEFAARAVARTLNGGRDPAYAPLVRPARNDERHLDETTRRWTADFDDSQWRDEQCGRCRFWIPLSGNWGSEWGACSNAASPHDRRATFEYDACAAYEPGPEWAVS